MMKHSRTNKARRFAGLLTAWLMLWASTSPAAAQSPRETPSLANANVSAQQSLLVQASSLASTLSQTTPNHGSAQNTAVKTPTRKAYLTLGLIGVGTAVAGLFVYRGANDHPHLPGIANGRETTGFVMITVGGGFGTLGLIKAFR